MAEDTQFIFVEAPLKDKKLFGFMGGRKNTVAKPGMHLYIKTQQPDGSHQIRRILEGDRSSHSISNDAVTFYHVGTGTYSFNPIFSKIVGDEEEHDWDCQFSGKFSVADSRHVVTSFAASLATPNTPLAASIVESWIANRIAPNVRDAVSEYSIEDLRDRQALPPSWWGKRLSEWLDDVGIAVQVDKVTWSSVQAEAEEIETARLRDLERTLKAKQKEQEVELLEAAALAEYKKQKQQIETDRSLSEKGRAHQLQFLEMKHRKEILELDTQIKNAQREAEKAALEHEVTLARLQQSAKAEEAEVARSREIERAALEKQKEQETERSEAAAQMEYQKQKWQIEADRTLSEKTQAFELERLEKQHSKEMLELEAQMRASRMETERAALAHEIASSRLQHDTESLQQAEEKIRQAEGRHETVLQEIEELKSSLARLADLPDNLLAQLADSNAGKANEAAERVVSPEFGVSAQTLIDLGFQVERQSLIEGLRQRADVDELKVSIAKAELQCRDIGTAKVKGLPVNTSLQFEFISDRSGYVTLLNVGTSGSVYIHVPNAYVPLEQAKVDSGRSYKVPGPELMPWDRLRALDLDYVEVGPPGWEHIAVLVSDKPIVSNRMLAKANGSMPFVKLTSREITVFCETLSDEDASTWSAGVLSFLVG